MAPDAMPLPLRAFDPPLDPPNLLDLFPLSTLGLGRRDPKPLVGLWTAIDVGVKIFPRKLRCASRVPVNTMQAPRCCR